MIYLGGGDGFDLDAIQTPHTGTCRSDDLLFVAQEYKFTVLQTERCGETCFFLWFLPLALMACLSSAETHSHVLHWHVQHAAKQTPLEST